MLAGNVAALLSPVLFSPILTYTLGSQHYDYKTMLAIRKVDDTDVAAAAQVDLELIPGGETTTTTTANPQTQAQEEEEEEERKLNRAALYSRTLTIAMVLCFLILWPIPMYGSSYVFSKRFFTGWVVVGIIWLFITTFGVVVFPLYEGRESIVRVVRLMGLDLVGAKGRKKTAMMEGQFQSRSTSRGEGGDVPIERVEDKTQDVMKMGA